MRYTLQNHLDTLPTSPPIICPSIQAFHACQGPLFWSVILPNLKQVSLDLGEVPYHHEGPLAADLDALGGLLTMIRQSYCQNTLTVISMDDIWVTDDIIAIAKLAPILDEWSFSWTGWRHENNGPLNTLVQGLSQKAASNGGETVTFSLLPTLSHLKFAIYNMQDYAALYLVGEILAETMEACLGWRSSSGKLFGMSVEGCVFSLFFPNLHPEVKCHLLASREFGHTCNLVLSNQDVLAGDDEFDEWE